MIFFAEHADNDAVINRLCTLYLNNETCSPDVEWTVDADLGVKPDLLTPTVPVTMRYDGYTARSERRSDEELEVRVSVACITPSFLDLGCGVLTGTNAVTIVHVSDLHYDPRYVPGNEVPCGEPLCCRKPQQQPGNQSSGAGHWGDYRVCDMPLWTIRTMLQHIREQHPVRPRRLSKLLTSHQVKPGSIPGRVTPRFCKWESCRMMPLVCGFSWGYTVSAALAFHCCSIPTSFSPSSAIKTSFTVDWPRTPLGLDDEVALVFSVVCSDSDTS
ncbi:hypothetical protein PR048_007042 [Dryococelus australis]|uniref:Uncharacterized protein n=1 Tax=Dryococelus australis TaxID=614101 RepID=A0ABQ9ICN5_9NEOP|nr:hypothetical protein PR048_007042 [Dryococelus australis]